MRIAKLTPCANGTALLAHINNNTISRSEAALIRAGPVDGTAEEKLRCNVNTISSPRLS